MLDGFLVRGLMDSRADNQGVDAVGWRGEATSLNNQ